MLSGLGNCNRDAAGSCMVLNFDLRSLKIGYFYATNFCKVKKNLPNFTGFELFFFRNHECNFVSKIVLTFCEIFEITRTIYLSSGRTEQFLKKNTFQQLLREGIIFLIHLFARGILLMKKLKIEETKAT